MKTISIKLMLLFIITAMLHLSCKKDDPAPPADNTKQLLQDKNWKMTAATISPAYYGITDIFSAIDECYKDDLFKFTNPDVYFMDFGSLKCDPAEPQTMNGTWRYIESIKTLIVTLDQQTSPDSMIITQINANSFTTKEEFSEMGVNYKAYAVFTKQ